MAIVTAGDESNKFKVERFQSMSAVPAGLTAFLTGLNISLSVSASLGNALILIALHIKVTSIYPPTKLFFRCLAVTDLCVGLISQPLSAIIYSRGISNRLLLHFFRQLAGASTYIFCTVSILTSTAISVDRLLALLLRMRYRHVVTLRRVRGVIICFWLLSCALGGWRYSTWGIEAARTAYLVLMLLSFLTSVFSYIKIYLHLRHHQLQVQGHVQQVQPPNGGAAPLNIARYKKTVSSIAWVQFALIVCYLPFSVVGMLFTYSKVGIAYFAIAALIVYFNSSLNPILYCWKIREVKQAVKDTIRQLNCCCESN